MPYRQALTEIAHEVDLALARIIDRLEAPERLLAAMRYALMAGGKRLRPFLLIESAGLFGVARQTAMPAAAALECLHTYSLVHDDLPAMDDDDLRRGKPTVHVAFDEATAILAGDGLLTLAFEVAADRGTHADPAVRAALGHELARAAGAAGMVGGQMLDLAYETEPAGVGAMSAMQAMKTGALFRFACRAGGVLGGASGEETARLDRFGAGFGAAFQITDDLIDTLGDAGDAGKRTGKDAGRGKATWVALLGADGARAEAMRRVEEAVAAIEPFGDRATRLAGLARALIERKS